MPWLHRHSGARGYAGANKTANPANPQSRMSVAPGARHSAVHRAMQSSNDKKSFLQRACSSPSIVSLYQEPFKEPDTIIADYNPPGNISNNPSLYSSEKLLGKNDSNKSHFK